jgi:hypothetical protein
MLSGFHREGSVLRGYLDEVLPTSEAPLNFHALTALSVLGAFIGRRAIMRYGSHSIYPISPTILVGPSGIGKSEAMGLGKKLLRHLNPNAFIIQDEATPQALVLAFGFKMLPPGEAAVAGSALAKRDPGERQEVALIAGEMSTMFKKSGETEGMLQVVTRLLEQDDDYARSLVKDFTKGHIQILDKPTLSFQAGTTVQWMRELMPSQMFSGGFIRRCLVGKASTKRKSIPIPRSIDDEIYLAMALDWQQGLSKFSTVDAEIHGVEMTWEPSEKWWVSWKKDHDSRQPEDERMAGHHNSMPYVVMRTAMVFAAAQNRLHVIPQDFNDAVEFVTELRADAMGLLLESAVHGFEEGTQQLQRLLMDSRDGMTQANLLKHLRMRPKEFEELITWGLTTGLISRNNGPTGPVFKLSARPRSK